MQAWSDGDFIGEYQLLHLLGTGGAGLVFLARHVRMGHHVVIKLLRPDRKSGEQRARFLREGQVLARLQHPGIVRLLHADTLPDGTEYLVLEHAAGTSLRSLLGDRAAPLTIAQVARILTQVATALAYAHRAGVVHRDVKPENLIVDTDAGQRGQRGRLEVTLIDFGLAWIDAQPVEQLPAAPAFLTQLETAGGARLGTLHYRAPELGIQDQSHSAALDAYALGVLGWELLSGLPPSALDRETAVAQLLAQRPAAPRQLVQLIGALLSPLPQARPPLEQVARAAAAHDPQAHRTAPGTGPAEFLPKFAQPLQYRHLSMQMVALVITAAAGLAFVAGRGPARLRWLLDPRVVTTNKPPPKEPAALPAQPVLVIAQPVSGVVQNEDIAAALPPPQGMTRRIDIAPLQQLGVKIKDADWPQLAARQTQLVHTQLLPALQALPAAQLAYFGAAPIPLAVHLGTELGSQLPVTVYQKSHQSRSWRWSAAVPTQDVRITGLPRSLQRAAGPVVLRVATAYAIDPLLTQEVVAKPLGEIDVTIGELGLDALRSEQDVAAVATAVRQALDAVAKYLPNTTAVHLFAAVPVGLALRLGMTVNPNVDPPLWTYQYDHNLRPCYHPAILIDAGRVAQTLPKDAMPSSTAPLIERRLENFVDWLKPDAATVTAMTQRAQEIRERIRMQAANDKLTVRSTPSAGSFAKNTGLRRHVTGGSAVDGQDVDIPFVLAPMTKEEQRLSRLLDRFQSYADRAYPQNPPEKSRTKSSIAIRFVGLKQSFDLVPMLQASEFGDDYQWLLRGDGTRRLTSVTRHNTFITRRSNASNQQPGRVKFNECVRLLKWWRDFRMDQDRRSIPKIPSLLIEMLAAHAFDHKGVQLTYSETLLSWFEYLHGAVTRRQRIGFNDYPPPRGRRHAAKTPWMVIEPVDPENNLTHDWIDQHIDELAGWLQRGREDLQRAVDLDRKNNPQESLHYLVRVFGTPFKHHCGD